MTIAKTIELGIDQIERTKRDLAASVRNVASRSRQWHLCDSCAVDPDSPSVPAGFRARPGVEYGCGEPSCRTCYEPIPRHGSIENPAMR